MGSLKAVNPRKQPVDEWQVREDLRTLQRAEEIKQDKKRMLLVGKIAQKEMNALQAVANKVVKTKKPKGK